MTTVSNYDKINFKTSLTFGEYTNLVKDLVEATETMYKSGLYGSTSFVCDVIMVEELTDIVTSELSTEDMWELITETPIIDDIRKNLGKLYCRIKTDVESFIKYNQSANKQFNDLFKSVDGLVNTVREKVKDIDINEVMTVLKEYTTLNLAEEK